MSCFSITRTRRTGRPRRHWSEANKDGVSQGGARRQGAGRLSTLPRALSPSPTGTSSRRRSPAAGGPRDSTGPKHVFTVKKTDVKHPISDGLPAQFEHTIDELYQNSMMVPGSDVLATAYSDPKKPRGTGKDEPVIWVNTYGKGRVYENVLGHDTKAMADPNFRTGCAGE